MSFPVLVYLQMLSMEMSRSCSYMDGWLFLLEWALKVDWECSLVTWILISPAPFIRKEERDCSLTLQTETLFLRF